MAGLAVNYQNWRNVELGKVVSSFCGLKKRYGLYCDRAYKSLLNLKLEQNKHLYNSVQIFSDQTPEKVIRDLQK